MFFRLTLSAKDNSSVLISTGAAVGVSAFLPCEELDLARSLVLLVRERVISTLALEDEEPLRGLEVDEEEISEVGEVIEEGDVDPARPDDLLLLLVGATEKLAGTDLRTARGRGGIKCQKYQKNVLQI